MYKIVSEGGAGATLIKNVVKKTTKNIKIAQDTNVKAKAAFKANADVIQEVRTVKWFLNWLRRLFIVSGLSIDDQAYHKKIIELYEFANYMEANK